MKLRDILKEDKITKTICYTNGKIKVFVLPYIINRSTIYISLKDEPAIAMIGRGSSMSGRFNSHKLQDVYSGKNYELFYKENVGMLKSEYGFDSDFLSLENNIDLDIEIKDLPETRILRDILIDDANDVAYVVSDKEYHNDYNTLKIHKITQKEIKELGVSNVVMYRDGGTTYYHTTEGVIFIETPFKKENRQVHITNPYDKKTRLRLSNETYNYLGQKLCISLGVDWPELKEEKIAEYNGK